MRTIGTKELNLILSTVRRAWNRYPERYAALNRNRVGYGTYRCEECGEYHKKKNIDVDHIEPVVPLEGLTGEIDQRIGQYVMRLFVPASQLRILCKDCHKSKSKDENIIRLETRKRRQRDAEGSEHE